MMKITRVDEKKKGGVVMIENTKEGFVFEE